MQLSVPASVIELLAQVRPVNAGVLVPPPPAALSCSAKVSRIVPALAVSVTVCAELTDETIALKLALAAPAGTVNEAGTATALLLLAKEIANPPAAAT